MRKKRIPTVLALALLIIAVILGVTIFYYRQQKLDISKPIFEPKNLQVVNLTQNSATLVWYTEQPVPAKISYDKNPGFLTQSQNDDRDPGQPSPHIVHFVTLKNLTPQTTYYYQIKSDPYTFPDTPKSLTTPKAINADPSLQNTPIRGTVLDAKVQPIDEALVLLEVNSASPLATYTTVAGNFILPLNDLRNKDLTQYLNLENQTPATLEISRATTISKVTLTLPPNQSLPAIKLGENLDLTNLPSPTPEPTPSQKPTSPKTPNFDLNNDGKINAVDISILLSNLGTNPKDKSADLNGDKVVDQKDLDLIEKALQ